MSDHRIQCTHCGGYIDLPDDAAGQSLECPHCRQQIEPRVTSPSSSAAGRWLLIVGLVLLSLTGVAVGWFLLRAPVQRPGNVAATGTRERQGISTNGFSVFGLTVDPVSASVRYVRGTVRNNLERARYGVKLRIDLLDAEEGSVGIASDYQDALQPGQERAFRALVIEPKASAARLISVQEDQ